MVLWLQTRFAVILVLSYLACVKTENDLQTISASSDLIQKRLARYCAKVPLCRYRKFLASLKDNIIMDTATSSYKPNIEKNLNEGDDNLEGESPMEVGDNGLIFEDIDSDGFTQNMNNDLDFFKPEEVKRGNSLPSIGCDCKVKNELLDLGHLYYPRYLFNAVCHKDDTTFEYTPKCLPGAQCRPLEYKVRVLTHRSHNDHLHKDPTASLLPEALRSVWKFKTVTIAAGCFCS